MDESILTEVDNQISRINVEIKRRKREAEGLKREAEVLSKEKWKWEDVRNKILDKGKAPSK